MAKDKKKIYPHVLFTRDTMIVLLDDGEEAIYDMPAKVRKQVVKFIRIVVEANSFQRYGGS